MMEEKNYQDLEGGILQSFGVLLHNEDKILLYPTLDEKTGTLLDSSHLKAPDKFGFFYQHLRQCQLIVDIKDANQKILHIYSRRVLSMIEAGESGWEEMVPSSIVDLVKKGCLYGVCKIESKK